MRVSELLDLVELDYEAEGRVFLSDLRYRRKHIDEALGALEAEALSAAQIVEYKLARRRAGAAESSINHELNWISRGFHLALEAGLIPGPLPRIRRFRIGRRNVRYETLSPAEFSRLCLELRGVVLDLVCFLYLSGWRFRDATSLRWDFVREQELILPAGETKEGKLSAGASARVLPLVGDLARIVKRREVARQGPHVFHRRGRRIASIRTAWRNALDRAGLAHRGIHSLRKAFCALGIDAGVDRDILMDITGHRTDDTFRRYNLVNAERKHAALRKMADFYSIARGNS